MKKQAKVDHIWLNSGMCRVENQKLVQSNFEIIKIN